jgi:hypothetical protein
MWPLFCYSVSLIADANKDSIHYIDQYFLLRTKNKEVNECEKIYFNPVSFGAFNVECTFVFYMHGSFLFLIIKKSSSPYGKVSSFDLKFQYSFLEMDNILLGFFRRAGHCLSLLLKIQFPARFHQCFIEYLFFNRVSLADLNEAGIGDWVKALNNWYMFPRTPTVEYEVASTWRHHIISHLV